MARKKPTQPDDASMPPVAPVLPETAPPTRSGSRHRPRKMVPLPPWLYERLQAAARRHNRPATWELRHIVIEAMIEAGVLTEEEVQQLQEQEQGQGQGEGD
jgi:predicted DNA-binding protein